MENPTTNPPCSPIPYTIQIAFLHPGPTTGMYRPLRMAQFERAQNANLLKLPIALPNNLTRTPLHYWQTSQKNARVSSFWHLTWQMCARSLTSTRSEAFEALRNDADHALTLELPSEPTYDKIEDPAERRLAYVECFGTMRKYHDGGMRSLALFYLLTGEKRYGEAARRFIVDAAQWDVEGISSILAPYGDEVGLGLLRAGAEVYDWIYDIFTEDERELVARMLGARADQMIRRLEKSDYTFTTRREPQRSPTRFFTRTRHSPC